MSSEMLKQAWLNYEGACVLDSVRRDNFRVAAQCVSAFGVNVGDMTAQFNYAHENVGYGAPASLTQYAMENVFTKVYDWVVEHKKKALIALNIYSGLKIAYAAANGHAILRLFGVSRGASFAGVAIGAGIAALIAYWQNRALMGLFNSLPGAVAAALAVPIPSTDAELPNYKAKVADVLNYSTWKDIKSAKYHADANHPGSAPMSGGDVQSIVESVRTLGETSDRLKDALDGLDAFAKQPAAQTPVGQHCVHYTSELIFRAITDTAPPAAGVSELAKVAGAH